LKVWVWHQTNINVCQHEQYQMNVRYSQRLPGALITN